MRQCVCLLLLGSPALWSHSGWGIQIDSQGRIVFTDVGSNVIWRVEADGRLTKAAENLHSHDLWLDRRDGSLYGEHVWYVPDAKRFESYLWRLDRDGAVSRVESIPEAVRATFRGSDSFAGLAHTPDSIRGIAEVEGAVYVADSQYRCLWKVAGTAAPERIYQSGAMWTPVGVAVKGSEIYVLEDRPNGWPMLLIFWASPRVVRLRGSAEPELVMAIDFNRSYVVLAVVILFGLAALRFVWYWRRNRSVLSSPHP